MAKVTEVHPLEVPKEWMARENRMVNYQPLEEPKALLARETRMAILAPEEPRALMATGIGKHWRLPVRKCPPEPKLPTQ